MFLEKKSLNVHKYEFKFKRKGKIMESGQKEQRIKAKDTEWKYVEGMGSKVNMRSKELNSLCQSQRGET